MNAEERSLGDSQSSEHAEIAWSPLRVAIAAVATSVAYLVGTRLGLALTFHSDAGAVLWPPNALLLAALLLSPTRIWWILLLAVLPPHLAVELRGGVPASMALCWYVSNCLEALIGAAIFRAWVARGHETHSVRSFGVFMLGATFFGTFVSSFVDAGFVTWIGFKADPYWDVWRLRFFSNMLATQTIVPAVMATASVDWRAARRASVGRRVEAMTLALLMLAVFIAAFMVRSETWYAGPAALYAPVPLLVWAALRFGRFGVNVGLFVLTMLAIYGAAHGSGPFANIAQHENALSVQSFLILVAVPLQLLAKVIGERNLAEEKAYDRQRLLVLTLKAARVGVWDMDLVSGQTSIDEQLAAMFDLPVWERREIASWMMRMHPVDLVEAEAGLREAQATEAARDESGDSPIAETVCRVLHRDISWHWILSRGVVLRRPDGTPYRATGIGIDVTESRRTAEAIRENEEQMELAAATADLGFWTLDVGTGELWVSEHCAALLGIKAGATPTRQEVDLLLGRSATPEGADATEDVSTPPVLAHEFSIVRENQEERWLATSARRVQDETTKSERLIGVVRDITERRKRDEEVEERQQALAHLARVATMGELSTTIVHELGQPVGAVTLNAETARLLIERNRAWIGGDANRFAVLHELIDDIVRDSRRAETVIGQLRRLMRREQRDREPVNIAIVVSEVLDLVRAELRKHDIAVEWEVSGEGLDVVVNRAQLHQVLLNIILNARDAMQNVPAGSRGLHVTLRREPFEEIVHVLIADTGMGIAADRLDEVFEPFVTSKAHGVGLGLAISRTIMADHGGDLRAESGDGGAVLHLTLPVMSKVRAPSGALADVAPRRTIRPVAAARPESDAGAVQ
jgi:signal transduction histidine kinase/integral membrane sensor domain MASE1